MLRPRAEGPSHNKTQMNIAAPGSGFSGLACLAAIARFHDLDVSEPYLLQVVAPGPDGRVTAAGAMRQFTMTARFRF